tara:strand:- start:298 stop:1347 length:1050 start_codon:yes stop_codon:yes gene_type:complete
MYNKSIYYFRNDLRVEDNIGFINCYNNSKQLIPIYIFENDNHKDFILNILYHLNNKININIYFGNPENIIDKLLKEDKSIDSIFFNCQYDIYSKIRDHKIINCIKNKYNININILEDGLLTNIKILLNNNNKHYTKYHKFLKKIKNKVINKPIPINVDKNKTILLKEYNYKIINNKLADRNNIINLLNNIDKKTICLSDSKLSIYLVYGILSVRELFYMLLTFIKSNNINNYKLINELYRREFYYYISYYDNTYINTKTFDNDDNYNLWINSKTDNDFINKQMKRLNNNIILDNKTKIKLISYLVYNLNIKWELGDLYFSKKLLDYDIILNTALCQYVNKYYINPIYNY